MKFRPLFIFALLTFLLTACNFTLAADITPPPDYVPPTPMPTLGPLYPANPPDLASGATIYAEKCAPCHGVTGLGDGDKGKQLPVTVTALGLPDIARKALPSKWFAQVTQGNLDRFMPPFASLNEQQKWDVVAYALSLHVTPEQIAQGKALCADCAKKFSDQKTMSALSDNDLVRIIKNGKGDIPAFGKDFTDDEAFAVAAYLRNSTFASPTTARVVPASMTPTNADSATPSAATTPLAGNTPQVGGTPVAPSNATAAAGKGKVSGTVDNQTGAALPPNLKVTLRAFAHSGNPTAGPQEIASLESTVNADGTFAFENVEIPEKRIYIAEVEINGLPYKSDFAIVQAGMTELVVPPIVARAATTDFSALQIDTLQFYFDFANADAAQIFTVYNILNTGDQTVLVDMGAQQLDVPFIAFPAGAEKLGYNAAQDTAPFTKTANGFAMAPDKKAYGLIAFASIPKKAEIVISQPMLLPVGKVTLFLPEGMEAKGATLTDKGIEPIQTTNYHIYTAGALKKGESIEFTITGAPTAAANSNAAPPAVTQNKTLLIGAGAVGILLIIVGAWLYIRERNKSEDDDEDEEEDDDGDEEDDDEFDNPESLMDAIIALDDLHRAGKLPDEAYQKRRDELKNKLKVAS